MSAPSRKHTPMAFVCPTAAPASCAIQTSYAQARVPFTSSFMPHCEVRPAGVRAMSTIRRRRVRVYNWSMCAGSSQENGSSSSNAENKPSGSEQSHRSDAGNQVHDVEFSSSSPFKDEIVTSPPSRVTRVVSTSAALQVDDGSLSESESFIMPRKLRKKETSDQWRPTASNVLRALRVPDGVAEILILGALFATWYWSNTVFNVYNKQILKVFPFPVTCTAIQFLVATVVMVSLWLVRLKKPPRVSLALFRSTMPLGALHAAGFLLTNMSLGKVSVAFTHTIKSTEPFFSVALTPSILGEIPTWGIVISLFPIVAGVALASATEVSFNWIGFLAAVGSNLALQSRNVLSKKLMNDAKAASENQAQLAALGPSSSLASSSSSSSSVQSQLYAQSPVPVPGVSNGRPDAAVELAELDNVNLFATMTLLAFVILTPLSLLWEGMPLAAAAAAPATTGMATAVLYKKLGLAGVCRCLDVLSSYMILQRVSPVTHSVGNCVKRAVVIAFSIVIFQTKMSPLNIAGTLLALFGVFAYSIVVSACKQNYFGPDSPVCKPIYEEEVELTEGGGI